MIHNPNCKVYVADCAPNGGIYVFDCSGGKLIQEQKITLDRPMYLAREEENLFCILRAPFSDSPFSGVLSMPIQKNGLLGLPGEITSTHGIVSCHLCVNRGNVYTANYVSGSITLLGEKIIQHTGSGPNPARQEAAHVHYAGLSPDGEYLFACDLGLDTVFVYDLDLNFVSSAKVPDGHGVRHLIASPDGKTVYSINELASTVSVFGYQSGTLTYVDTVAAAGNVQNVSSFAAAIKLSGNCLYTSHRGIDEISVLDISQRIPRIVKRFPSGGHSPRDFAIVDQLLIVTNEDGTLAVLDKKDGSVIQKIQLTAPLCVLQ